MNRARATLTMALLLSLGTTTGLLAQSLLSVTSAPGTPVVRIDPVTGAVTPVVNTNVPSAAFGFGAWDPFRHRLFFLRGGVGTQELVIVDMDTQAVSVQPIPIPAAYIFFEYDPYTDRILSVTSAPGRPVVAIDPGTGAVQTLFDTGVTTGVSFSISAFDPSQRRLYFLAGGFGTQELVTVNLHSETITLTPIPLAAAYVFFEWDPIPGRILSVTSQPGIPVVSIDPSNGSVQTIVSSGAPSVAFGLNAIDVTGRRLFFESGGVGAQTLITVNVDTTAVSTTPISIPSAYLFFEYEQAAAPTTEVPLLDSRALMMLAVALAAFAMIRLRLGG